MLKKRQSIPINEPMKEKFDPLDRYMKELHQSILDSFDEMMGNISLHNQEKIDIFAGYEELLSPSQSHIVKNNYNINEKSDLKNQENSDSIDKGNNNFSMKRGFFASIKKIISPIMGLWNKLPHEFRLEIDMQDKDPSGDKNRNPDTLKKKKSA